MADEFGKRFYKSHIIINFSTDPGVVRLFEENQGNLDGFFDAVSVYYSIPLYKRDSLIVFDEAQFFPKAREKIKSLVRDHRYDYIETGSLVSLRQNVNGILIPSEEKSLEMHPMDFEEFCWALGNRTTVPFLRRRLKSLEPLGSLLTTINRQVRSYMVVGGMPQSVSEYVKTKSFLPCEGKKRQILGLYRNDIAKLAQGYVARARVVFDSIPAMLSHHDKKAVFSSLGENVDRSDQFEDTLFWLSESKMARLVYRLESLDALVGFKFRQLQG
ncbi:MAG: AAA family ATPase [Bacilli bacterium]|nr:AAA family ATPase [Bacilli bacterium]